MTELSITPLLELCDNFKADIVDGPFGANLKREHYKTEGIPVLKIQNIKSFKITLKKMDYVDDEKYQELIRHSYRNGDIVMTKLGDPLGESAIVENIEDGLIVADLVRIRAQKVDTKYLCYHLNSPVTSAYINSQQKGTTRPRVRISVVRDLPIYTPPLAEQKRIVAILDQAFADIEQARAKTEQNLKNARELFESYLQQVFSQRGEGWRVSKLKEVTSKIGSGATPRGGRAAYKSEGTSLIRSMNVHDRRFKNKDLAFIDDQQADKLSNVVVENNDVLLNITGASVARCCLAPEEYLPARVNQHVSIIRVDRTVISPAFLNFVLTSKYYKDQLLGIGEAGSTRQAITKTQIEEFEVSYPESLEEQQNLLSSLYSLEEKTNDIQRIYIEKLLALDELKKSILQKAFSGELTKEKEGAVA